ncbi:MAG TPA: GMC family oxidoreductase N-terminal domain-containing protein [Verrucomicrobiae bacterium]|nr:GMC family oxidoreductase N-terminal domain-containing protein [Verrucomicrobiae bacterium]
MESGLCASHDLGVSILAGACVGGGTAVNWSTSLRLRDAVAAQWERSSEGVEFNQALRAHYDAIAQRLAIAPASGHNANNAALLRGAQALAWSCSAQPRNAPCTTDGCGYCPFGCAYGTKGSTDRTFLRDVLEREGRVSANSPVEAILVEDGRAVGVCARIDGEAKTFRAPLVACAAGTLRTPKLLAGAGVRSSHLGAHLHLHPTTGVFAEFAQPIETWIGPAQSALSDEFAELADAYGVVLEVAPAHPGLAALSTPWLGREAHAQMMGRSRFAAALIAIVRDRGEGHVTTDAHPTVRYRLDPYDADHLRAGISRMCDLAIAAGALRVSTLHNQPLTLERDGNAATRVKFQRDLDRASLAANRVGLFSAHQMGTARMSERRDRGVVDGVGRVYGIEQLLVTDASVFPLASGVNPMLTIMALAHRSASRAVERGN